MKKQNVKLASLLLAALFMMTSLNSCMEEAFTSPFGGENGNSDDILIEQLNDITCIAEDMETTELTDEEAELLIFMREEEKLARDVYLTLYDEWGQKVFQNIANSEQQHTDAIKMLIEKYELTDPVTNDEIGVFENEELQELYNALTELGSESIYEALKVGGAIEEIDILDLEEAMEITDNEDINLVYQNLLKGSENHLRAFVRVIERQGYEYAPQYLTQAQYDEIVN